MAAQSAEAVKYADCVSDEEYVSPQNKCPDVGTKLSDGETLVLEIWKIGSTLS